ncbi:MAG: hypothetical protein QMD14_06115 [Candidatus Aenigmarchaeota archaeon]|nr:hypothetical protein [Candidatus Aenigmarchaeota archaeon]
MIEVEVVAHRIITSIIAIFVFYFSTRIYQTLRKKGKRPLLTFIFSRAETEFEFKLIFLTMIFSFFSPVITAVADLCLIYNLPGRSLFLTLERVLLWAVGFLFNFVLFRWWNRFRVFK